MLGTGQPQIHYDSAEFAARSLAAGGFIPRKLSPSSFLFMLSVNLFM
jgi:hypothetical protein